MMRRVLLLVFIFSFHISFSQEEIPLEQIIALALEKNYDIQVAKNVSEAATTDNQYVFGVFLPQINAVGATVWNNNNQELRFQDETRNNSGKAEANNTTASL